MALSKQEEEPFEACLVAGTNHYFSVFSVETSPMPLDILTIGEALVEVMRTNIDQPLNQPRSLQRTIPQRRALHRRR